MHKYEYVTVDEMCELLEKKRSQFNKRIEDSELENKNAAEALLLDFVSGVMEDLDNKSKDEVSRL